MSSLDGTLVAGRVREALEALGDRILLAFLVCGAAGWPGQDDHGLDLLVVGTADARDVDRAMEAVGRDLGLPVLAHKYRADEWGALSATPMMRGFLSRPKVTLVCRDHDNGIR